MKNLIERVREMRHLLDQLRSTGVTENMRGYDEFVQLTQAYIRDGKERSGHVGLPGTKRAIFYVFPRRKDQVAEIILKYLEEYP